MPKYEPPPKHASYPREPADPIEEARTELAAMSRVLDILEPFGDEERARILAAVAARFGFYDLAIATLRYAAAGERAYPCR